MKNLFQELEKIYPGMKWYGPYLRSDGRTYLVRTPVREGKIRRSDPKTGLMLSRALMELKIGRRLLPGEEVDHVNGDNSDDSLENLQVLTKEQHREKSGRENSLRCNMRKKVTCPFCDSVFEVTQYLLQVALNKSKRPCCSRSCASKMYGRNQYTSK